MNVGFAKYASLLVIVAIAALSSVAFSQQKKGKWDTAPAKAKADSKMAADADAPSDDGKEAPKGKIYRFKAEKKGAAGGTPMMILLVEDVFTGKSESLFVPNNDATSKEYDPLSEVATTVKDLAPGAAIEVETEKVKGRTVVKSVAKADAKPGEELPNGFVFIDQKDVGKGGVPNIVVTLSKFGREIKAAVPMFKSKEKDSEGKWEPDPKVDYQVRRLQSGTVVEATVKPGKMPMLTEIYEYRTPERGKFVGPKEVDFENGKAAAIEITSEDGTAVTFTLEGTEQTKNGKTIYIPNPQQVAAVRKLKKDTPVEVRYRLVGQTWILRAIRLLGPNESLSDGTSETDEPAKDSGKMSDEPEKADESMDDDKANDKTNDKTKDKSSKTEKTDP